MLPFSTESVQVTLAQPHEESGIGIAGVMLMCQRLRQNCLLRPGDLRPLQEDLEILGVFNPGVVAAPAGVVLLVRVAEAFRERRKGWIALPRWDIAAERVVADWVRDDELVFVDPRVVLIKQTGLRRLTFTSHLRVVHSRDGLQVDTIEPEIFRPSHENEEYGVEDPRITPLEGRFYFTYVAVSRHGAATALASTTDFKSFTRHGIVFPPENKDVVLFPEKIAGDYWALHRPNPAQHFSPPEMWIGSSSDLIHWGNHAPFLGSTGQWDADRVGAGTPPLRTADGWLEIYHGAARPGESGVGAYVGGALLLDLRNPRHVLAGCGQVLTPQAEYDREGFVPNVVFPTGIVEQGENVLVYYGACDSVTAVVELRLNDLLQNLRRSKSLGIS